MSYNPPTVLDNTAFPTASDCDLATARSILEEKFQRFFPALPYYQRLRSPDVASDNISGTPPETVVDDLWGEDVPAESAGGWVQPHSEDDSPTANAPDTMQHADAVDQHFHVDKNPSELDLKKFGIDETAIIIAKFLTTLLDTAGITISIGDYFIWDSREWDVLKEERTGRWKHTNVYLYVEVAARLRRPGS